MWGLTPKWHPKCAHIVTKKGESGAKMAPESSPERELKCSQNSTQTVPKKGLKALPNCPQKVLRCPQIPPNCPQVPWSVPVSMGSGTSMAGTGVPGRSVSMGSAAAGSGDEGLAVLGSGAGFPSKGLG